MRNINKRMILSIFWIVLGAALFIGCTLGALDNYWSGMGGGLMAVGVLQLIRYIKYKTNAEYKENVDTAVNDERNKYISNKAWAWAGYIFVLIAGLAVVVFKITGREELSIMAAYSVCLIMILYWISYTLLRKKY